MSYPIPDLTDSVKLIGGQILNFTSHWWGRYSKTEDYDLKVKLTLSSGAAIGCPPQRLVSEILPFVSDRQIDAAIRLAFLR